MSDPTGAVRLPPQNVEAEERVLGAVLLDNAALPEAMQLIGPEDFYKRAHRLIFEAMRMLLKEGKEIDILTVADALRRMKAIEHAGGPEYVARLADQVSTARGVKTWAALVLDASLKRQLVLAGHSISERAQADPDQAEVLLRDAQAAMLEIGRGRSGGGAVPMLDKVKEAFPLLEELYDRKQLVTGLPTGFADIDAITAGLQRGELCVVAGRPSMGKTAFALNVAEHAAAGLKVPAIVFSLEMSGRALAVRMMCGRAGVNARQLQRGFMPSGQWPALIRAAGELGDAPLLIDDSSRQTPLDILARARRAQAEIPRKWPDGPGLGLVVVDYLQLIGATAQRGRSREQEVAEVSAGLKALAKDLDVPVLAVAQLSRQSEQREEKRPRLSDLRESGAIEQDADLVILLHRPAYYEPENADLKGRATAIVAKQRNGPTGDVELQWAEDITRFRDIVRYTLSAPASAGAPPDGPLVDDGIPF